MLEVGINGALSKIYMVGSNICQKVNIIVKIIITITLLLCLYIGKTKCQIITVDCNNRGIVPPEISSRVRYLPLCLGGKDTFKGGREYVTYETLLRRINATRSPAFVKLDIEGMYVICNPHVLTIII